ncbi:MAG: hypothetical protein AB1726_05190 [Planctomycetota bacterium]
MQFMIVTPFPGTRRHEVIAAEDRLLHERWEYSDGMHAAFRPRGMTPARLQQETLRAYRRFYSLERVSLDALRLALDVLLDALVLNFGRVHLYSFENVFLRAGGRFLVGRYGRSFRDYLRFLAEVERPPPPREINGPVGSAGGQPRRRGR